MSRHLSWVKAPFIEDLWCPQQRTYLRGVSQWGCTTPVQQLPTSFNPSKTNVLLAKEEGGPLRVRGKDWGAQG